MIIEKILALRIGLRDVLTAERASIIFATMMKKRRNEIANGI